MHGKEFAKDSEVEREACCKERFIGIIMLILP